MQPHASADGVEDFRGDFDQLAMVMQNSWADGANPPYLYSGELMADHFRYPGLTPYLAPSIYHDSELVAFVLGCPRRAVVAGVERRLIISAFLTVAPEHKSAGYGIVVWSELMRRAAATGFDGAVHYCVDGEPMHRMIEGSARRLGLPLTRLRSFSYLVKTLSAPPSRGLGATVESPSNRRLVRAAAEAYGEASGVWRRWSEPEAAWQLSRLGAVSVSGGTETGPAVMTGTLMEVADATRTRCLVIDDVLWGGLAAVQRAALVIQQTDQAARRGAQVAIVPRLGYADMEPFLVAGFVPVPHTLHAYLSLWNGAPPAGPAEPFYLDVV